MPSGIPKSGVNKGWFRVGEHNGREFLKGHQSWNKGIVYEKMMGNTNGFKKGQRPWNYAGGKPKCVDCGKQLSNYRCKRCVSCSAKFKMSDPEFVKKVLRRRNMSGVEIKVNNIIKKYNLPYKFVGNGEFFIEGKNPDFVNINGEKKVIEVYWKKHKDKFRNGGEVGWMNDRNEIFSKYGWDIIYIESAGLNEKKVLSLIGGGSHF